MAGRWTRREDLFLAEFYDQLGDYIGVHDLNRPAGAALRRVQQLKKIGEWVELKRVVAARALNREGRT